MAKRCLCCLLALLLALSCAACGRKTTDVPTTEPSTVPETTAAPTTEATEPETEPPTEAPTEPPLVLHSGLREDGSFNEGTLFIGDSLTFQMIYGYMRPKGFIGDAKYIAICGSRTTAFFDGTRVTCSAENTLASKEFDGLLFSEAVASLGEDATAVYIMWGINFTKNGSSQDYIDILDYILENCPNATIHLQTVPHAHTVPHETVNERIRETIAHYRETGEERVFLLDSYTGIGICVASDGVHLNDEGKVNWYNTLLTHAKEQNLPE